MDHRSIAAGRSGHRLIRVAMLRSTTPFTAMLLSVASAASAYAAESAVTTNWAADAELEGIVDLLDLDYLKRPINVARLPIKYAITTVHGRGERTIYTFEDPNCGYCRQLTQRLARIGNITVHTFMITFLGEDSRAKADAVWCAASRPSAWQRVMAQQSVPAAAAGCRAPTGQTMKLVGMLGINLTPTLFFADGSRLNGIKPQAEIEARLQSATRVAAD